VKKRDYVKNPEKAIEGVATKRRKKNLEEIDDLEDSDIDLEVNWVEFAIEIHGVEMLKDVNVEEMVEAGTEIAFYGSL